MRKELYYIRIGKEIEHRDRWSKYDPNAEYGFKEAYDHAFEAKARLSTGRRKVVVEKEIVETAVLLEAK